MRCPECGGFLKYLATLGRVVAYQCEACGFEHDEWAEDKSFYQAEFTEE